MLLASLAKPDGPLGLWGEPGVSSGGRQFETSTPGIASLPCSTGEFPSVGRFGIHRATLEQAIADLVGLQPAASPDLRPWLDHGRRPLRHPWVLQPRRPKRCRLIRFLPTEGESCTRFRWGRFTPASSNRPFPLHRQRRGRSPAGRAAGLCPGVSRPAERCVAGTGGAAGGAGIRRQHRWLMPWPSALGGRGRRRNGDSRPRALVAGADGGRIGRLANHCGDIGAVCNDAAFALMLAHCAVLRERVLRASAACFRASSADGLRDSGGVAVGCRRMACRSCEPCASKCAARFRLVRGWPTTPPRCKTAPPILGRSIRRWSSSGCGGVISRAAGRVFDARREPGYPPDQLEFEVPVRREATSTPGVDSHPRGGTELA